MLNKQYEGRRGRLTHRALCIVWTDQWPTLTCSMPARQGTRERKNGGTQFITTRRGRKCVWKLLNTHRSLSVHAGHVDDGAFGLDQVGHAEMSQVVHGPGAMETKGSYQLHLLGMNMIRNVNLGQRVLFWELTLVSGAFLRQCGLQCGRAQRSLCLYWNST